jgi:hypothetical protein
MVKPIFLALVLASAIRATAQLPKPLFSEDFESGAINSSIWTQNATGDATITLQQEKVAHGKYALRVSCPAPAQKTWAFLMAKSLPEVLRHHLFGRASVYITAGIPARHTIFLTAGTSGFPKNKYQEVATANGKFQLTFVDQVNGGEDWHPGPELPTGRWILLEWEFNDQPNQATIWVDGVKAFETAFTFKPTGVSTGLVGGFTDVAFGFRLWGAAPVAFDIYYDDIALDTHRIGPVN